MKRLDNLVNEILENIVKQCIDLQPESNEVIELWFDYNGTDIFYNVNVSLGYEQQDETYGFTWQLTSVYLNSVHVTSISSKNIEFLTNVTTLLNEKLSKYENKYLELI